MSEPDRKEALLRERRAWAELYHIYDRCVAIAETVWDERLDSAQGVQHTLAEQMRERGARRYDDPNGEPRVTEGLSIPVPLFTPRDRLQFLKEVAATLLISADRRNLTALYKDAIGEPQTPEPDSPAPAGGPSCSCDPRHVVVQPLDPNADYGNPPLALVPDPADEGDCVPEAPTFGAIASRE